MRIELLKNIANIIAGQSPPSESYNKSGEGIPFFQGMADYGEKFPVIRNWCKQPTKISIPNDILISVRAPVGPVNINNVEACIGRGISAVRAKKNYSYEYIFYFLKANEKQIANLGVGSTFTAITQKDLGNIKISVPETLADQIKIATVLSKVETLIKLRKENIDLLDKFLKSTFFKIFGDPIRNEKGWETRTIEELVKKERHSIKRGPFGGALKKEIFVQSGFLVYEQYHALNNDFTFERYYINEKKFQELKAFEVSAGDIIISCSGVYLGKLAIIPNNAKKGIINQALLKVSLDTSIMSNEFFAFLFSHESFRQNFLGDSRGSGIPNFPPMNEFKKFKFIYPAVETQLEFTTLLKKAERIKAQFKNSLLDLENLYGSLSQRAFKGKLDLSALDVFIQEEGYHSYSNDRTEPDHFPPPKIIVKKKEEREDKRYGDPFEVDEATAKKQGKKFYKQWQELHPVRPHKFYGGGEAEIKWEWLASQIKDRYENKHFNFEMLMNFIKKEKIAETVKYYSSEEMKANPKLNDAEDIKAFLHTAITNVLMDEEQTRKTNLFLKLKQVFYNAEKENFQLILHKEDFKLLKNRTAQERSGMYFTLEP